MPPVDKTHAQQIEELQGSHKALKDNMDRIMGLFEEWRKEAREDRHKIYERIDLHAKEVRDMFQELRDKITTHDQSIDMVEGFGAAQTDIEKRLEMQETTHKIHMAKQKVNQKWIVVALGVVAAMATSGTDLGKVIKAVATFFK